MLCFPHFTEISNNSEKSCLEIWEINALTYYVQSGVCVSVSLNESLGRQHLDGGIQCIGES